MIKIKNLIRVTYIFVIAVIILALFTSFYLTPKIQYYQNANLDAMNELRSLLIEKEMQLRIFENIDRQGQDRELSSTVEDALERNLRETENIIERAKNPLSVLHNNYKFLESLPMNGFADNIREFQVIREELEKLQESMRNQINNYEFGESASVFGEHVTDYRYNIEDLEENLRSTNNKMISDLNSLGNITIILLIGFLLLMSLLYYRIYRINLPFFQKILTQIAYKGYDSDRIPLMKPLFKEEKDTVDVVNKILEDKAFSKDVKDLVSEQFFLENVMEILFLKIRKKIDIDRIGVGFVDYNQGKIIAEYGILNGKEILLGPGFDVSIEKTSLKSFLTNPRPEINNDLEATYQQRPDSGSLKLLMEEGIKSNMIFPLMMGQGVFGMVFFSSKSKGLFKEEHLDLGEELVKEIAPLVTRGYFAKIVFAQITQSFSELVEGKYSTTGEHISRMVAYSSTMAKLLQQSESKEYQLNDREILSIERYAPSHDIGKISVPDSVLKKQGPLTSEEWLLMKEHPVVGADVFKHLREGLSIFSNDFFITAENIARYHHERWDGTGYPEGISRKEIPLEARIVAFGDVLDALCSERPYKKAFSLKEAAKIIEDSSGTHFDPLIVKTFLDHYEVFEEIHSGEAL